MGIILRMKEDDIIWLFEHPLFVRLLSEHHRLHCSADKPPSGSSETLESPRVVQSVGDLLAELSEEVNSIVSFNLKLVLADEFTNILQDSAQVMRDLEDLKEKVLRIGLRLSAEDGAATKQQLEEFDDFEESLEHEKVRLEENNMLLKLKNEVQAIRCSLLRFASAESKEPRSPARTDQPSSRLEESRLIRLGKDLQSIAPASSPSVLEENSTIDRFSALERQLESLREVVDQKARQEAALNDKYESTACSTQPASRASGTSSP